MKALYRVMTAELGVSIPRTGFINLKVRQPEASSRAIFPTNFGGTTLKVRFQRSLIGSTSLVKSLKLLTCQGSEILAGGGGFLTVLSPAKKIISPSHQDYNIIVSCFRGCSEP